MNTIDSPLNFASTVIQASPVPHVVETDTVNTINAGEELRLFRIALDCIELPGKLVGHDDNGRHLAR